MGETNTMKRCAAGSLAGGGNTGWKSHGRLCKSSRKTKRLLRPWNIAKTMIETARGS